MTSPDSRVVKEYLTTVTYEKTDRTVRKVVIHLKAINTGEKRKSRQFVRIAYKFNEQDILTNAGKIGKAVADQLALEQYEIFHQHRLTDEAQQESLAGDAEFKRYLEKKSNRQMKETARICDNLRT